VETAVVIIATASVATPSARPAPDGCDMASIIVPERTGVPPRWKRDRLLKALKCLGVFETRRRGDLPDIPKCFR
jgi:hypothetical protein